MAQLSGDLVRHQLNTRAFGQNVVHTRRIGSTNTELKRFARQGAPEGLLYLAEEQLVGRGRRNRRWYAPPGSSLLLSLLFRPETILPPDEAQQLTMLCALAMAEAIENETGLRPALKWSNDIVWKDAKKLAGILTETEFAGNRLSWVVVGIGVNVNIDFQEEEVAIPGGNGQPPLSQTATSLSTILGREVERLPILRRFLRNVEARYDALAEGHRFQREWSQRLIGLNQVVTITGPAETYRGRMIGVNAQGALLLQLPDGSIREIVAGDFSLR